MQIKKTLRPAKKIKGNGVVCLITLCVLSFFIGGTHTTKNGLAVQGKQLVEDAIRQSITQCYALEGYYPPNLDYLETHYGLRYDTSKYIVHYESFAANIYPDIFVLEKGW